ncbi:RHS repeat domain-containing protein [Fibrobacter sp.]
MKKSILDDRFCMISEGNLTEDKSKRMKISYDWRGMPVEFRLEPTGVSGDTLFKIGMLYDGTGRRISKTRWVKARGDAGWSRGHVTHYTGIGTEVRENFAGPAKETKVVVNMPQGLGRYGIEDADHVAENGSAQTFEWYLKNHLGSTMLVYGTGAGTPGGLKAAYDYRSFGEQVTLTSPSTGKVTENFTGKEKDDETQLDYFGARYLDPMLGMWISVDPARQFASPYLYAGNGMNPIVGWDDDGNELDELGMELYDIFAEEDFFGSSLLKEDWDEMKNSYLTYHFVFSEEDYAWNIDETNTICLPSSKNTGETKQLQELAVFGRHEYDHLKGIPKAAWHDFAEVYWRTNDYFEVMKKKQHLARRNETRS